jgi:NADH-quinone oxidoreductase subunit A
VNGYSAALALLAVAVSLVVALYLLAWALRPDRQPTVDQAFLSGHRATEHAFSRFHVRWYPLTMIYLAFEMEMLFMYPWALVVSSVGVSAVVEMFVFLGVLLAGVGYAWREGALRWT